MSFICIKIKPLYFNQFYRNSFDNVAPRCSASQWAQSADQGVQSLTYDFVSQRARSARQVVRQRRTTGSLQTMSTEFSGCEEVELRSREFIDTEYVTLMKYSSSSPSILLRLATQFRLTPIYFGIDDS